VRKRMKIVLTANVPNLGKRGDIVSVADGYARNYLIPRGLGLEATPPNLTRFEAERQAVQRRTKREAAEAEKTAKLLDGFSLTVKAKAGEEGRLFGSVTAKDISAGLKDVLGIGVDRKQIELHEPLKAVGRYLVAVHLGPGITREINVNVEPLE